MLCVGVGHQSGGIERHTTMITLERKYIATGGEPTNSFDATVGGFEDQYFERLAIALGLPEQVVIRDPDGDDSQGLDGGIVQAMYEATEPNKHFYDNQCVYPGTIATRTWEGHNFITYHGDTGMGYLWLIGSPEAMAALAEATPVE